MTPGGLPQVPGTCGSLAFLTFALHFSGAFVRTSLTFRIKWRHGAFCTVETTADVIADADERAAKGLKAADALHVASAAAADCDYFITTDIRQKDKSWIWKL